MIITAEISMYPFDENYRNLIQEFVAKLKEIDDLRVDEGPTSTVVVGDSGQVMPCLGELIEWSYEAHGTSAFVVKFIPGYDPA